MRIYGPTGTRNFPTDRNPSDVRQAQVRSAIAGGTNQNMVDYTVPALRAATVEVAEGTAFVSTALAAGQGATIVVQFDVGGGLLNGPNVAFPPASALAVDKTLQVQGIGLRAGHRIVVNVAVDAGVGALIGGGGLKVTEYDA